MIARATAVFGQFVVAGEAEHADGLDLALLRVNGALDAALASAPAVRAAHRV